MKLTAVILTAVCMQVSASVYSQRISLSEKNAPLVNVLKEIRAQSGYLFLYDLELMERAKPVTIEVKNASLKTVLRKCLEKQPFTYELINRTIVIKQRETNERTFTIQPVQPVQPDTLRGTVTDSTGYPLPGISVLVKGTSAGTSTDNAGRYRLPNVPDDAVLVFSMIGFQPQEVLVNSRTVINVVLKADVANLEEVVVVGYGTQKKVNLTGAVESIDARDIVSRPVGQASMALQGLAPGVAVTQNSGKPGSDGGVIRIRGIGTIGDSNPLVLVDGIPSGINDVDVNEIESISVLKDAASAAIYGSRAANGVILVTTKRASDGQFVVNYRTSMGWQGPTALMDKVGGYDHMVMINEAFRNVGQSPPFMQEYIDAYKDNAPSDEYPETDWHDVMLKDRAFQQNHYLSINGGGEKIRLLGSLSYMDQDGLMNSNYKRINLRLNSDIQVRDNLKFGIDILARNDNRTDPPQSWYWLARYPENLAGKNEDGTWGVGWDGTNGWASLVDGGIAHNKGNDLMTNIKMDWQPFSGLNIGLQVAPGISFSHNKSFQKHVNLYFPDETIVNASPYQANLAEQYTKAVTNNYKVLVDYGKNLGEHSFKILGGWEAIDYRNEWIRGFRDEYPLEKYDVLNVGSTANQTATGSAYEWALMSFFGRLNYNFNEKYLFEVNLRADGSSRFTGVNKYGFFPSFSAGWRISEEPFMSEADWANELKIRASWGSLGNQNVVFDGDPVYYPFASAVSMGQNYVFGQDVPALGAALIYAGNRDITWETTKMANIGFDASLWRFDITADYYIKNTSDILLSLPVPRLAGLVEPYQNAGKVRNKGWDFRIQYTSNGGDFHYRIGATLSDVKNEIVDLVGTGPYIDARTIRREGYPIDALFGLESLGYFQNEEEIASHASQFGPVKPGDIKYRDQVTDNDGDGIPDGPDGIVNAGDRVIIGSTIPRYTYGLNFSCDYKGFDLGVFVQGVGKADGYLDNFATMAFYLGGSAQEWHKDHWTEDNPNAAYPRLTFNYPNNEQVSSQWIKSAAYLRVKNVQLGYTLPKTLINRISVDRCRIYLSGQNLFTLDNFYDSYDPEAPAGEGTFYPMVKVFVFGTEITF